MSRIQYKFKYDEYGNTREIVVYSSGTAVSSLSFVNKGTAFTAAERVDFGLEASLPPGIRDMDDQVENTRRIVDSKVDDMERFIFVRALYDRNVTLAHALIGSDLERFMGLVYTPTISEAVRKYSSLYRQANGLHFYPGNIDKAEDILRRYLNRDIRVAVVTDSQTIPGMGDQGAGGIAVCLGKIMLYTQAGGIAPWHCLPISLDVGTDNERLLADSQYLGWRNRRLKGEEYLSCVGRFVRAFRNVFPDALCQWENFSRSNAFGIRDAFSDEVISFNDNIQSTGALALACILSALRLKNERLDAQRFLVYGDDAGSVGVCEQILAMLLEEGVARQDALEAIHLVDGKGLMTSKRKGGYYLKPFVKSGERLKKLGIEGGEQLADLVKKSGATVYISTSEGDGCLDQKVVQALLANSARPVILPLHPAANMKECCVKSIYEWSDGKALAASGSPKYSYSASSSEWRVSQANTILIFPGIAQGALASGSREVLPGFFTEAAKTVSGLVSSAELERGQLLPPVAEIERVNNRVALAVAMRAVAEGVSRPCVFSDFQHGGNESRMRELIERMRWRPRYLPLVAM